MSWPKVLVLAGALLLGFMLHGGIYQTTTLRGYPLRTNRLTGLVELYGPGSHRPYWKALTSKTDFPTLEEAIEAGEESDKAGQK